MIVNRISRMTKTLLLLFLLSPLCLAAQVEFMVDNKLIKTGVLEKRYNFYYDLRKDHKIVLTDSVIVFSTLDSIITKEITYPINAKYPRIRIKQCNQNGHDSLSRHFIGERLICTYQTLYDTKNRYTKYSLVYEDTIRDKGFEWNYTYQDSISGSAKFEIQRVFYKNDLDEDCFHFMVISEFDSLHRVIREIRKSSPNDTNPQVIEYSFDKEGKSSGSILVVDEADIDYDPTVKSFYKEKVVDEIELEYPRVLNEVQRLLNENKEHINRENWVYWQYTYVTASKNQELSILNKRIHNEKSVRFVAKVYYE